MTSKPPIWTKAFLSLFLTNLSVFIVFYGLVSALPLHATGALQRTDEEAGLLMTIFLLSAIVVRPFTGKLIDVVGKRKLLLWGLFFYLISTILYIFITPFEGLLFLRFFQGIWFSIITTAAVSITSSIVPPSRRGAGLGYFVMSSNLAVVVGPFIALYIIQAYSFHILFVTMSVLMVLGSILSLFTPQTEKNSTGAAFKRLTWSDLFERKALPIATVGSIVSFAYASVLSYLSIYAQGKDLLHLASTFFAVYAAVMLGTRPFTGKLFDEKGPNSILIPGFLSFGIGLFILAFVNSPGVFLLAGAFVGFGYGALVPSLQTLAIQSTSERRSGYATATFFTFFDTGLAIGSYVLGVLAIHFGYQKMYLLSSLLIFVVLIFYRAVNKKSDSLL